MHIGFVIAHDSYISMISYNGYSFLWSLLNISYYMAGSHNEIVTDLLMIHKAAAHNSDMKWSECWNTRAHIKTWLIVISSY